MIGEPFQLGVNYWPRQKAMFWWQDFEAEEVREEFSVIAALGMGWVRIFLLWEDWQPTPHQVNPTMLDRLGVVCDIAAELGLKLDVTFFTGHMSGPSWTPAWMLWRDRPKPERVRQVVSGGEIVDCDYRNPYHDPLVLAAAELLLQSVIERFHDHPAIGMWNLGNEPDLFAWPDDAASGRAWVRRMTGVIKDIDPVHPVTCGLHADSLFMDNGLRVNEVFAEVDFAVMHGYPMYVPWARSPLDPHFVPFLCSLTAVLAGKPTLMEEWGGCTVGPGRPSSVWSWEPYGKPYQQFMAAEAEFASYVEQVNANLVEAGALGSMLWCFADYVPELWDRPPCLEAHHERFFGLVRPDGSLKPHAAVIRRFAQSRPIVQAPTHSVILDISPEEYYQDPTAHAQRLYERYLEQVG